MIDSKARETINGAKGLCFYDLISEREATDD